MNQIKEKSNNLIYVSLKSEIEIDSNNRNNFLNKTMKNNPLNKEVFNEKELILNTSIEYNNIQLNEEAKKELEEIKNENK